MQQVRSAAKLFQEAGLLPAAALAVALAGAAHAQDAQPPRDPMKPATGGASGEKGKVVVSEHMTVDIHVKDENIANVLELLSIQSQKNIIASRNVQGKVSADLYNVTFDEALDAILNVNGFVFEKKGNFIYVRTIEEQRELEKSRAKRIVKVIRLNYLNANDAAEFVKPLLSQGGEIKTSAKVENFSISENVPGGKNDYALGDALAVIDLEDNVAQIEKLVAELDTKPAQVLIEATILETKLNEENAFGIDFSIIGNLKFSDLANIGGPRRAADSLIRGGTGAAGGFSPPDNGGVAGSSTAGNTADGRSSFKLAVVSDFAAVFARLLDDVSDTTVLSSPKVMALNRQPSRVLVGQRVGYLNTTSTETSTTQTVEFLDTGTQLYFRPFVSNTGEIRMELKPQVSSATIRDAGNGQGGTVSIPDETTQEIVTNVIVKDGSTIVLGGLFVEDTFAQRRQVPVLGDIPILGAAFRGHDDRTNRRELIFLIRPSIVNDTAAAMQGIDVQNDIERIRAGQRQGLLFWSRERMTSSLNVEAEAAARDGDSKKALWLLQRSLSLNPRQPEALRLRERITGEREVWPDNAIMDGFISGEVQRRINAIPPATDSRHLRPEGSITIPREKVEPGKGVMRDVFPEGQDPTGFADAAPAGEAAPAQANPPSKNNAATAEGNANTSANGNNQPSAQAQAPAPAQAQAPAQPQAQATNQAASQPPAAPVVRSAQKNQFLAALPGTVVKYLRETMTGGQASAQRQPQQQRPGDAQASVDPAAEQNK
jgi:type IV pilus assembly protein PilQ